MQTLAGTLQMKKLSHGRLREDTFHVNYLSYGLILFSEISMLEGSRQDKKENIHNKPSFIRIYIASNSGQDIQFGADFFAYASYASNFTRPLLRICFAPIFVLYLYSCHVL